MITQMAAKSQRTKDNQGPVAVNKKAYGIYELIDKFEAGIQLLGSEVKSLRDGQIDFKGSYVRLLDDECWLVGANISPYKQAGIYNHEPLRKRKLLLHKAEIVKIKVKLEQRGFTFVPLKLYFNSRGLAKIEVALARGKRQYDKRKSIAQKQQKRDLDRDMKKYR
jgi:SsrA-binding protein